MKKNLITLLCGLLAGFPVVGQGEALFKAKCNTCHAVDKNSTGPMLKGVKAKWNDAGEGALLYEWVKDSKKLILSGKSKMALAIQDFSKTDMSPQQATPEEVDQILDYVDSYTPPPPPAPGKENPGDPVELLPDYHSNLTIFYALIGLIVVLLIAIILMSSSILTFVKSDLFKAKLKEEENKKDSGGLTNLVLIIVGLGTLFIPNDVLALSTPDMTDPTQLEMPWLKVENVDIYILICINIVLLLVVIYLRNLFNSFYYMVYKRKEKKVKEKHGKVSKILVDSVPIEEEASILMDHEYDGIRELDNNLPPWWVWGFYLTILFAVGYILYYHVFNGPSQLTEYNNSMTQAQKEIDAYLKEAAMNVDENNVTLLTDPADLDKGKSLFQANCATCHKDGSGDIGPNLTDNYWLYGNDIKDVFGTIKNGTSNGMPEHASKLNPIQLQDVASYVLSLKYIPGKEPQGTEYPKK
ncbi:c-type cytochrome [Fluviicola sp.]|uniref:c-type cytochrome n=1 Tax=Fluviicola sp. TaxID=1917219 RepID=UPI00260F50C4|nr:c-type cytochrome [Fluviicola sp.]